MAPQTEEQKAAAAARREAARQEGLRVQQITDELAAFKEREAEMQQNAAEFASFKEREAEMLRMSEQLKRQLEDGDGVEQGPRPKKTARETIEGYVAENDGNDATDDIIAITKKMSDELLVNNIKSSMEEFKTLLLAKTLCDKTLDLAKKIGADDDPLEKITANPDKFLPYILISTIAGSATKDKKVMFQGTLQPIDEYRKVAIGEKGGKDDKSRVQMFNNRVHAGICYEQFFLQADDSFKLASIPQVTSLATELGRVASASQDKTRGKLDGHIFKPKHIPEAWNRIMTQFPNAQPPYKVFKKALRRLLFGDPKEGNGDGTSKEGIRETCRRALKQIFAMKECLREKNDVITDDEILAKTQDMDDVNAEDVLKGSPRNTPSPPTSTTSTSSTSSPH